MWSRTWRACACSFDRARLLVGRLLRVEKRLERRLRVDDDLLAAGQVDDADRAGGGRCRRTSGGCSSKSQRRSMPAISTTRRSCISPQRPRTAGVRSARDSVSVVEPSALTFSVSRA